jgi:hypothetical protein
MAEPYIRLTPEEKNFHLTSMTSSGLFGDYFVTFPVSGLLPSGEGNFYDLEQYPVNKTIYGHNGLIIQFEQGSEPLTYDEIHRPYFVPVIGVSGLKEYASGDVSITYVYNGPDPSGGTGKIDKLPYNVSFDPDDFLIRNSG